MPSLICPTPETGSKAAPPADGAVRLSILFPAYNEEAAIRAVVEEADTALRGSGVSYEIVVLDDASTDRTGAILQELAREIPAVRLLRHEQNRGIAVTLGDLFAAARGEWLFNNGSDGQWKTAEVLRMMPLADGPRTIVVGRRKEKHYSPWRSFVSAMYNLLPRVLFGVRTYDAGSIKLIPRILMEEVTPRSAGVFREGERLILAARAGYKIVALDVDCAPRTAGKAGGARFALVAGAVRDLIRCWWRLVVCRDR
jgi:glycosyltransferase involved in cell wall biosynthesis